MGETPGAPVLHYAVPVARLPEKGLAVTIEADERERAALAVVHGLEKVGSFRAELHLSRWKKRGVRVRGAVRASIVQTCVVTLDPLDTIVDERIDALFLPDDSDLARRGEEDDGALMLDPEGPDLPETFTGDALDAGAIAEEFFELAIDPYPRREGVALPDATPADEEDGEPPRSPFASLANWKPKR